MKIERIYRRNTLRIPKIRHRRINKEVRNRKIQKVTKICIILVIAFLVSHMVAKAIGPIIDKQCIIMAKSIATKISNEQATKVMSNYTYEDLMNISKDDNGNVKMISANMIVVNQIISNVQILIQDELNKTENSKFNIKLGSFSGNRLLAGRGPNVEIKMSAIGDLETNLKSEFNQAGINQTLHRIYLEVKCNVTILTPFNNIEQQIANQMLLAENIIVGEIPSTYYDLEGIEDSNLLDVME